MEEIKKISKKLKEALGLEGEPVAVFLLKPGVKETLFNGWEKAKNLRYCQAVMQARHGSRLVIEGDQLSCPAAASAFGFRELPSGFVTGQGLVGFGIVEKPETGKAMFEKMPKLAQGALDAIALCPLRDAPRIPDVVVVEGQVEELMWLILADLNINHGKRSQAHTAVLQAVCVDATIIPYEEKRLNFSYGCYGCREATDLKAGEAVLGFPGEFLEPLAEKVAYLSKKAIQRSRAKKAYQTIAGCESGTAVEKTERGYRWLG